jgi:flagellar biosynthesis chaperone FliJ
MDVEQDGKSFGVSAVGVFRQFDSGSWVNLQRQLDLLQRDVTSLLESQRRATEKVETLQEKVISHEFRLKQLEKYTSTKSQE